MVGEDNKSGDNRTYTVSELTSRIKTLIEGSFGPVVLKGEVSNYKLYSSGHAYFSLKDDKAQISAVMFKGDLRKVAFIPKDGMLVEVRGRLSVYPTRGQYQIIVSSMTQAGQGAILEELEKRKKKLAAEGLFDEAHKKNLPRYPSRIGVVTSSTGAAIRDILKTRRERNNSVSVVIFPSHVQGELAAPEIVAMIRTANRFKMCDVLIVGRGGGSLEDLLPFSDERVVRAVYESEIPVISAVGHEIDWALCDYAADARAVTPTAAAVMAIPSSKSDIMKNLMMEEEYLYSTIRNMLASLYLRLRVFSTENMKIALQNIEQRESERFDRAYEAIKDTMKNIIKDCRIKVERYKSVLEACNPETVLSKGYSVIYSHDGKIVRDAEMLSEGETVKARFAKGGISATVIRKDAT